MAEPGPSVTVRVVRGGPWCEPALPFEPVFRPPDLPAAARLRKRFRLQEIAGDGTDFQRARRLMNWVRGRWNHGYDHACVDDQGDALKLIAAGAKGKRFSCGNYAATFVQCCLCVGLPARRLSIRRKETDFPHGCQGNHGHVVSEAYCRDLGKWVLLDADLNAFYKVDGTPASALELHRSWHRHRGANAQQFLDEPRFVPIVECEGISRRQMQNNWRDFSRHRTIDFYYYLSTWPVQGFSRGEAPDVPNPSVCFVGEKHPPMALNFTEGRIAATYTDRDEVVNWPIDRTFLDAGMLGRRPTRRIELRLGHTMPQFSHYELSIGRAPFARVRGKTRVVTLPLGRTTVRARCTDVFGKPGHDASLTFEVRALRSRP